MKAYTFRDWLRDHRGMSLLRFDTTYRDGYPWWQVWRWLRVRGLLWECWYYLKCRLWRRYNTVTAPTLPPTWSDAVEKLLHVSMAILVDVVEKEDILNHCAWTEREHMGPDAPATPIEPQYSNLQEIATIYDWWKNVRPLRQDPTEWWAAQCAKEGIERGFDFEEIPGTSLSRTVDRNSPEKQERALEILRESSAMECAQADEDTEMICRLARVRQALWT